VLFVPFATSVGISMEQNEMRSLKRASGENSFYDVYRR